MGTDDIIESPVRTWRPADTGDLSYRVTTPCCGRGVVIEATELERGRNRGEPIWVTCGLDFWLRPQKRPGCGREWAITPLYDEEGTLTGVHWQS